MKIVIAGAGAVGFHLAELLTRENQDITIIDTSEDVLQHVATHVDVMTIKGDTTSIAVLEEANIQKANLFVAVTTSETTNLLSAILAKQLGAGKTIARVNNPEYLLPKHSKRFEALGIEKLISPEQLAAFEIERLLTRHTATDVFEFENGKISIIGYTIRASSGWVGQSLTTIRKSYPQIDFKVIALLRQQQTTIPTKDTILQNGDHIYIAIPNSQINALSDLENTNTKKIKRLMIIGSTQLALKTAQQLEKNYQVTLVVNEEDTGKVFLEILEKTLVVKANYSLLDNLKEEGLSQMDAFIALTPNSETNIITSLMSEELGVFKTIALVDNVDYIHLSQKIGIDTMINKKIIAANEIFRFVRKGKIEAIVSLHGVEAEVIEFEIHRKNHLLRHPICQLHFPNQAIVAGVIRGHKGIIPNGDFRFALGDKVIVLAKATAIPAVEKMFK